MASKKVLDRLSRWLNRCMLFFMWPLTLVFPRFIFQLTHRWLVMLNDHKLSTDYFTLTARPKNNIHNHLATAIETATKPVVILIQGQVTLFTVETVKWYSRIFPSQTILVSTWNDTPQDLLNTITSYNASVVLSSPPNESGFLNFNYQHKSTTAGLNTIMELDVPYVLKTRTDQRIYSPNALALLTTLSRVFPPTEESPLTERIWLLEAETLANVPLTLCDMMQFGQLSDVCKFWDVTEHQGNVSRSRFDNAMAGRFSIEQWLECSEPFPEMYLGKALSDKIFGQKNSLLTRKNVA